MMTRKTNTKTLLKAMRILARDIQSDDGVANGAISEAADRMEELQAQRDRLREALERITEFDNPPRYRVDVNTAYSVAVGAVNIARTALQEAGDE